MQSLLAVYDLANNWVRYWNDCQAMYKVLKQKYGFVPSHIYCLVSDGTNPANDRRMYDGTYDSSPLDFDNDGNDDIGYSATKASITTVFDQLSTILTQDDYLYIFSTDHGSLTTGDVVLNLWNDEITATQFATEVNKVNAGHISVTMEQCYSGGFIPKLCTNNRTVATACAANELSYAMGPDYTYNEFVYHWICAMGWETPQGTFVNADNNSDGNISLYEAFNYAQTHDAAMETPQYCSQGSLTGADLGLLGELGCIGSTLDLYIKDRPWDLGTEPNNLTDLWLSTDIWTRNQDDGIEQHQNLQYDPNNPGYVYVRIRNRSCQDLAANTAQVKVYFAKAGTFWANWPFPWTNVGGNPPVGGEIGHVFIPAIPAGGEAVVHIPWANVPNPQLYSSWPPNEIHHFCILARIVSNEDPMYSELIGNSSNNVLAHNISYNNNVAMKNISIVDFQQFRVDLNKWVLNDHAAVKVGTALSVPLNNSKLRFAVPTDENGNPITTDAEVKILLDPTVWAIWQNGGAQGSGFSIINPDAHELLVTEDVAELTNLNFPPQTLGNVAIQFNFLTEVQDEKNNFTYDLTQFNSSGEVLGGERFQIVRPARDESDMFEADIDQNSQNSLTAQSINEPATYSWYSADTTLIDTGMNFVVTTGQPTPAFLSVTADTDGYKDYVAINTNSAANGAGTSSTLQAAADSIVSLSPNPASSQVMVEYHIGSANAQSAQLKVTYVNNPAVLQVVNLNPAQSQKNLNIGGYAPGVYIISLYVDGQQKDSKQLIIQ